MYGPSQAGALANKALRKYLAPFGYYECAHTPGLWCHATRPIQFTLVIDDFGVKFKGKEHVYHLIQCLQKSIKLKWNYENGNCWVQFSVPGYIERLLRRFGHQKAKKQPNSPYQPAARKFGKDAQDPIAKDDSPRIDQKRKKRIQPVVGRTDMRLLTGPSYIVSEQAAVTENTKK
ncbi:hypothetical protein ACHAWF_007410 [Thalassiosira exigua]